MSNFKLESPEYYHELLWSLRRVNKYAKNWKAKIEMNTNKHPDCSGYNWGWYVIFPLDILVGYWSKTRDDLRDVDIKEFNKRLSELDNNS